MRTRRIMKEKVLTTVVTFETTTQAIAMERECKKNKFTCGEQDEDETASYMKEQDLEYEKIYRILA